MAPCTRQYIAERIIEDLDIAIENLQWKGSGSATAGRINKEAALIMKSRVGLYEGSWEYYHGRKNTPFKASEDKSAFFLGKAVEAGQMLIDKHGGNLYKGSTGNEYFDYFTQYDYSNVPGAFLYKVYSRSLNVIQTWGRAYSEGFNGGLTRDAVDCYLMTDGKPAEISSVTYDPKLMNSLSENKDPRLDQTIWTPNKGRFADLMTTSNARSEERRVGKEC